MTDTERIAQLERLIDALAEIAIGAMNRNTLPSHRWHHYMKREDGSRCIYCTTSGDSRHYVLFDTLDAPVKTPKVEAG